MATCSSTLAWEIPRTEELGIVIDLSYSLWGHKRFAHNLMTKQQNQHRVFWHTIEKIGIKVILRWMQCNLIAKGFILKQDKEDTWDSFEKEVLNLKRRVQCSDIIQSH